MRKLIPYMIMLLTSFTTVGQHAPEEVGKKYSDAFIHEATELYDWKKIENTFATELSITPGKAHDFFMYAFRSGSVNMNEYFSSVLSGTIDASNAQHYWVNRFPEFTLLYTDNYLPALQKRLNPAAKKPGNNSVLTGGENCNNLDFSDGTNGWTGEWNDAGDPPGTSTYGFLTASGLNSSAGFNQMYYTHELCTTGPDPNVPINKVPPGHTTSLRLGNDSAFRVSLDETFQFPFNHQVVSNTFLVTEANKSVSYWYAVVLSQFNPNNHNAFVQPFFSIRMYDQAGNEIVCAQYDINTLSAASIGGFNFVTYEVNDGTGNLSPYDLYYKDWSQVMIPLSDYVGQNVTITFETSDCTGGAHFAYAYIAVDCAPLPNITVNPIPCAGGTGTLVAPSGAASYTWTGPGIVGAGNTQTIQVNAGGTYSVTMTTLGNSGFTCSFGADTVVAPPPLPIVAEFSTVNIPCSGTPVLFSDQTNTNGGTINSWHWDFGDGAQSSAEDPPHVYNAGTYTVNYTVTTTAGCTDTYSTSLVVSVSPTAAFSNNTVCVGGTSVYSNTSTGAVSYSWNFGDGSPATNSFNPTHLYASAGTFQTTLTTTSNEGCVTTVTHPAVVNALPVASFSHSLACIGSPVNFTNTSSILTGTYDWSFGDAGSPSNTAAILNPSHQYNTIGTYTVSLAIDGGNGCVASVSNTVLVSPIPSAAITQPLPYCPGDLVASPFIQSVPATGIVYSWTNTNTQTGMNASGNGVPASFPAAANTSGSPVSGIITVTPTLNGCVGPTASYSVQVKPTPALLAPVLNYCPGDITPAINLSSTPANPATVFGWTYTNPSTPIGLSQTQGTSVIPSFTANNSTSAPQSALINATVSLNGCAGNSVHFPITVHPSPVALFSHSKACAGNSTQFTDQSQLLSGSIESWSWDLNGDGQYTDASGIVASTIMETSGYHDVGLEVVTDRGCRDRYNKTIYVNNTPVVNLSGDIVSGCPVLPVNFTSIATIPAPEQIAYYYWSFGNGTNSANPVSASASYTNPSHTDSLFYNVSLEVTSDSGCISRVNKEDYITVFPEPLAEFSWSPITPDIIDPVVSFINGAIGTGGTQPIQWYLGDHSLVSDADNYTNVTSPVHVYPYTAGAYDVTQWVMNAAGCRDSITKTLIIEDAFTFYIPNAFSPHPTNQLNNGFKGTGIGIDNTTYTMLVFDRWGELIFESHDLEEEWNGMYKNKLVPNDIYVWKVDFNDTKGFPHQYAGTVTVVR